MQRMSVCVIEKFDRSSEALTMTLDGGAGAGAGTVKWRRLFYATVSKGIKTFFFFPTTGEDVLLLLKTVF